MTLVTGWSEANELPKSPRSTLPSHWTYCSEHRLVEVQLGLQLGTWSGVAFAPRSCEAAFPGITLMTRNVRSVTHHDGTAASRRLPISRRAGEPQYRGAGLGELGRHAVFHPSRPAVHGYVLPGIVGVTTIAGSFVVSPGP